MDHNAGNGILGRHGFGDDTEGGGENHETYGHSGKSVTVDQMDITTYLHSDGAADGSFNERLILKVRGFEHNGLPVNLPGFGTNFGMNFLTDATGQTASGVKHNPTLANNTREPRCTKS